MYRILKGELISPSKFRERMEEYICYLREEINKKFNIRFDFEELSDLILSACRANDFDVIYRDNEKLYLDEDRMWDWVNKKLIPNTIIIKLDDEDILRLLIFCIEITYQMFAGGTRATVTQKGFRQRRRTFESILVDQFVGKLGEVITKKFLENKFPTKIELDWEISKDIERYRNDIINAKKKVSIKTTPTLAGVWAEADIGYDYGITVKCSVPQPTILQFFIEVCGFSRLLDFAEKKIPSDNSLFQKYLDEMRKRIKNYKCGEIQTEFKGFVCGFFKTAEYTPIKVGESLPYLGEVREERYIVSIKELKWKKEDWRKFLEDVDLV